MTDGAPQDLPQTTVLSRMSLRDQAVEVLREMLLSGGLAQGDRINEVELAGRLGISRGPLREAIQRLGAEGIVEFRQNRGAFVRTIGAEDLDQLFQFRELIECKATELVATRGSAADIARLREHVEVTGASLRAGEAYPRTAGDLHRLVLEMCGNPYLQVAGDDMHNQVRLARTQVRRGPQWAADVQEEHDRIVTALERRDPDAAARAMAEHLRSSLTHMMEPDD